MSIKKPLYLESGMNYDQCVGAAVVLSFVIDLFTISGKKMFAKEEVVNVLDLIAQRELPEGLLDRVKQVADEKNGPIV